MSLLVDIEKSFGGFTLRSCFETGNDVTALLGASGCGKSMTLKCIAGIEKPDRGRIVLNGETLFDSEKHINLLPQKRHVGFLFQQYALFPHMTVEQNVRCGLRTKENAQERVNGILQRMHIAELKKHRPDQLSGGQQQRTALARILVGEPEILLLDEPFSALDSHLRFSLERELSGLIRDFGKTVIMVSHDRDEVYRLADNIAVMSQGRIERFGTKKEIFAHPGTRNAAILTGCKNISPFERIDAHHIRVTDWGLTLAVPEIPADAEYVGIRLHDVKNSREGENIAECTIEDWMEEPFSVTVWLHPVDAAPGCRFGRSVPKGEWEAMPKDRAVVSLPKESILMLE